MSPRPRIMDDAIYDYLPSVSLREPDVLKRLRDETSMLERGGIQIAPEQAQLMALLVELMGAKTVLEIGTFTGYSALCLARALPDDGRLVTCDVSEEWTDIARRYWAEAGVAARIELRLAPAAETLAALLADPAEPRFDFAFIDGDKEPYAHYYEQCLKAGASDRPDRDRQRALDRQGDRRERRRPPHPGDPRGQPGFAQGPARSHQPAAHRRRPLARARAGAEAPAPAWQRTHGLLPARVATSGTFVRGGPASPPRPSRLPRALEEGVAHLIADADDEPVNRAAVDL